MSEETIDATAVEVHEPTTDVVPHQPTALSVTPQVEAAELVQRLDVIRSAMQTAMTAGVDYGVIPGTGSKPALLKPGAEKLGVLFQADVQLVNEKIWGPGDHLTVMSRATVFHAPTGSRLGFGEGMCSTRERKYAVRKQERTCPACGTAAIIKGKAEYGGGWVCFKKKNGCGAKYSDGDQQIEGQQVGEVENPDLPDTWNTVVKMAEKRARVDAILAVTGASAIFTQDVEDTAAPFDANPDPSSMTPPHVHDVQRTGASDVPSVPVMSQPQYEQLKAAATAAGWPMDLIAARMDQLGVPAEADLSRRVGLLTAAQADGLIEFLSEGSKS